MNEHSKTIAETKQFVSSSAAAGRMSRVQTRTESSALPLVRTRIKSCWLNNIVRQSIAM